MLGARKKQHACRNFTNSCFVLVVSRTDSAVLERGTGFGKILGTSASAQLELVKGITQSPVESLCPSSASMLSK